jgi:hypothetical protein
VEHDIRRLSAFLARRQAEALASTAAAASAEASNIAAAQLAAHLSDATPAAISGTASAGVSSSASRADHTHAVDAAPGTPLREAIDDAVALLLTAGANIGLSYNDAAGTLTISVSGVPSHQHSATDITSGTLADARLSSNVPLLDAANVFTAAQQIGQAGGTGTMLLVYGQSLIIQNTNADSTAQFALQNDARMFSFALSGASGDSFVVYDNTAGATRMLIDANGSLFLYALRVAPATPASGEIYVDASGYLKRG